MTTTSPFSGGDGSDVTPVQPVMPTTDPLMVLLNKASIRTYIVTMNEVEVTMSFDGNGIMTANFGGVITTYPFKRG